ncbi:beta-1,3-glucosyltransferase-like [Mercenaria mercenaria]|uniref:beta-1,3-glucosyltransferase-like n=1 Tax=Mercenaria mercenaria TaxID=6596 RepID=UPI00234F3E06|nr:beta-1,3-glucosyltransferase-like [Mercenaria mercenaria]
MVGYRDVYIFLVSFTVLVSVSGEEPGKYDTRLADVVIVVLSQPNPYHADKGRQLQIDLMEQMIDIPKDNKPAVYLTHKKWPIIGAWTIFPLLEKWQQNFPLAKWIFFCEDETRIHLKELEKFIQKFDPTKDWFIGHALVDKEPTIIHHFTSPDKLTFPDFAAGVFLSFPLINKMVSRWPDDNFRADFAIDPKHELASYILLDDVKLTHAPELCLTGDKPNCVTYIKQKFPDCGAPVADDDLFVAVKTCEKFHSDRVPIVLETWAQETSNIEFYSEKEDRSIPTIDLGIPNTERGHCGKTMAIMKRVVTTPELMKKQWLLIADDDTIINLPRLRHLLSCYDPNSHVALGERYGYQVSKGYGYDYITGGGGMVFSMPVVQRLVDECHCSSNDSPDNMIIGMCLRSFDIPITHVPYLHRARPDDYSEGYLSRHIPVSFHKHWNCDPIKIYNMLKSYDLKPQKPKQDSTSQSCHNHEEL